MPEMTEEELKQMSPEQLKELQKQNCLFCRIVAGSIPAKKIYEDNDCLAVLDINPANPGHILLLPKEHYQIMPQVPEDITGKLFMVAKALALATLKSLKSQGTTIFAANGVAAGQRAPHFMIHIIPRIDNDGVGMVIPEKEANPAQLEKLKQLLAERMKKELGIKEMPIMLDRQPEKIEAEVKEEAKKEEPEEKKKAKEQEKKKAGRKAEKTAEKKTADNRANLDAITDLLSRK